MVSLAKSRNKNRPRFGRRLSSPIGDRCANPISVADEPVGWVELAKPIAAQRVFCPTGQISKNLSSPSRKNFSLSPSGKSALPARAIPSRRGALAIVTNVGTGCGGRGSVGRACFRGAVSVSDHAVRRTNDANVYGKTVWSWHPLLVSSWRRFFEPNRVFDRPLIRQRR